MPGPGVFPSESDQKTTATALRSHGIEALRLESGAGESACLRVGAGMPVVRQNLRAIVAAAERLNKPRGK